ncbi:hypothetical protein [Streptomyces sp. NPDC002547]
MEEGTPQGYAPVVNATTMPLVPPSGPLLPTFLGPRPGGPSHPMPFRCPVDAVRDAYPGYRTTAVKPCGAPVATGRATPAVTVGTPVFRTAGA